MAVFFTSDTHFGHANIIEYCNRPFSSAEEMDEELIRRWNETVGPMTPSGTWATSPRGITVWTPTTTTTASTVRRT